MALSSPPGWSARLRPEAIATIGAMLLGAPAFALVQVARSHGSWEPSDGAYRRMPGDHPDGFLPAHARVLAPVRAKVAADRPLFP